MIYIFPGSVHIHMNVEIGTEAAQFLLRGIFRSNFQYCVFAVQGGDWGDGL